MVRPILTLLAAFLVVAVTLLIMSPKPPA